MNARTMISLLCIATAAATLAANETSSSEQPIKINRHAEPARVKGWSFELPANMVRPESGKRNHIFYVGEPVIFKLSGSASTYEVRDYFGNLLEQGPAGQDLTLKIGQPGWYKLYVYGGSDRARWGDAVGTTTFVIFRNDPNFPKLPEKDASGGGQDPHDEIVRAIAGMGPQRHSTKVGPPEATIATLNESIELDNKMYLPLDPVRKRALMIAFPGGTGGHSDDVSHVVRRFKDTVEYWASRSRPNTVTGGRDFATRDMREFYNTVKNIDGDLKVMGPATDAVSPGARPFLHDFFRAGGMNHIDVFSFQLNDGINGDVFLYRRALDSLQAILAQYGGGDIEKWQTKQGFPAALYGSYQPRLQGRWTMLQMMILDQYEIPKEHNHLWYDRSHGDWDHPYWWINEDGGLNPSVAMMRVLSEELFGTTFKQAYDFGKDGNKLFLGNMYTGEEKNIAAFINTGCGRTEIEIRVRGGSKLHVVSAFGVESDIPVKKGIAKLTVPEVPVYLELAKGQLIAVPSISWGDNMALGSTVTVRSSGTGKHPVDPGIPNSVTKIINGKYENWYWGQTSEDQEWMDNTASFPAWIEISFPVPKSIARVVVFSGIPWQWRGTLIDHELQYENNGKWFTLNHIKEPTKTFGVFSPPTRTTVDSFFADRWIFEHRFKSVTTRKLRLLVNETTWGGGATELVEQAGGQTGPHNITLREVEVYGPQSLTVHAHVDTPFLPNSFDSVSLSVAIRNAGETPARGIVETTVPTGWTAEPAKSRVVLPPGARKDLKLQLKPPSHMKAGSLPFRVDVHDSRGNSIDSHGFSLTLFPSVEVTSDEIRHFDSKDQPFSASIVNLTSNTVDGMLIVKATELTMNGRVARRASNFSVPANQRASVKVDIPGIDLTKSTWHISYTAQANNTLISDVRLLGTRSWMVLGPFENEFAKDFGPEKGVDLTRKHDVKGSEEPAEWRNLQSQQDGYVNLANRFSPRDNVCAYAFTYLKSPRARRVMLSVGSDDGARIWINGKLVLNKDVARSAKPGDDSKLIDIAEGWNEVLLKITQGLGEWGFYFDLLDSDGGPIVDLIYSTRKVTTQVDLRQDLQDRQDLGKKGNGWDGCPARCGSGLRGVESRHERVAAEQVS
jgi:hypothetical protein